MKLTKAAYVLLSVSISLILIFILAILITLSYGHIRKKVLKTIDAKLDVMLNAFFIAKQSEPKQVAIEQIHHYVNRNRIKKNRLIHSIINLDDTFIEEHSEKLNELYEHTRIKIYLIKQLSARSHYNQSWACRQLGEIRCYSSASEIYKLMSSEDNDVVYNVLLALAKFGDCDKLTQALLSDKNDIGLSFRSVIEIMAQYNGSEESKEALFKKTIELSDDYFKGILIKAAVSYRYESLATNYINGLKSSNIGLQIASIRALSELKNPRYETYIMGMFDSEKWEVRAAAAKGLTKSGTRKSFNLLKDMLSDKEWWVRHNAAATLIALPGGRIFAQIIINGDDRYAREALIAVLEE